MKLVLSRLVLPVVLAAACAGTWYAASWLGDLSVEPAPAAETDTIELPMTSVRRVASVATEALTDERRALAVSAIAEPEASLACTVVMIDDQVVHETRADTPLLPGFTQLLQTGHTAIEVLGPDHVFVTQAMAADRPSDDGTVAGNLYVIGGGDPVLMSYNYARSFRPIQSTYTPIEDLAQALLDQGLLWIAGSVVGVERRYDDQRFLPGWPETYAEQGLVGPTSALQLDDGFVERAAANNGVAIAAENPAQHAAERFDDLLEAEAVRIDGLARAEFEGEELPSLVEIARVESAPLVDIVFQMLAVNDASAAEMLLKEVGFDVRRLGSTQGGADGVALVLDQLGVELDVAPRDGSGLDPISTSTCRTLAAVAAAIPGDHPTIGALPAHDLPGVYGGAFADVGVDADLRLVGGQVGDTASFVARTVDDGTEVVIASIVNRAGGTLPVDVAFHRELVQSVDGLRLAWVEAALED